MYAPERKKLTRECGAEQEVVVKLPGDGTLNLPLGTNLTFAIDNVRNVYAGLKDGFDISLLLSDEVSYPYSTLP